MLNKVNFDKIEHSKKNRINKMDDLMLAGKFIIQQRLFIGEGTKTLGVVPMAGKPVHIGHWKLIEIAAKENEKVLLYVSYKGRVKKNEFPIEGDQMIEVWNEILKKYLPKNVSIKFVDSPVSNVRFLLMDLNSDAEEAPITSIYSDVEDIQNYNLDELNQKYSVLGSLGKIKLRGVERTSTVDISGTRMREFLQSKDKNSFLSYLPPISDIDKEKIWNVFHKTTPQ
jgi:ATP sulfurylase